MSRKPPPGGTKRRLSQRAVKTHLYLFCEGEATEEIYFNFWFREHRDKVLLTIDDDHGSPMTLVQNAVAFKQYQSREAARGRGTLPDQIWCVFDEDEHHQIPEAQRLALENDISVAFTSPCIELWFLLHFQEQWSFIDRHDAQRDAYECLRSGKRLTSDAIQMLAPKTDDAKQRAMSLELKHARDQSPPGSNPSSNVWRLVDEIRK